MILKIIMVNSKSSVASHKKGQGEMNGLSERM